MRTDEPESYIRKQHKVPAICEDILDAAGSHLCLPPALTYGQHSSRLVPHICGICLRLQLALGKQQQKLSEVGVRHTAGVFLAQETAQLERIKLAL